MSDSEIIQVSVLPEECPFCVDCKTDKRGFNRDEDDDRITFGCGCCGAMGPLARTADAAVEMWNMIATSVRNQKHQARVSEVCNDARCKIRNGLKKAGELNGTVVHNGHYIIGHDRKLNRVALAISETMPSVAIDPMTAVTLAKGLLHVAGVINPDAIDYFSDMLREDKIRGG